MTHHTLLRRIEASLIQSGELFICSVCEDASAGFRCSDCGVFLCPDCSSAHQRSADSRSHHVVALASCVLSADQGSLDLQRERKVYCALHPKEDLNLFCRDCDIAICRECAIWDHNGHSVGTSASEYPVQRSSLCDALKGAEHNIRSLLHQENEAQLAMDSLDERALGISRDVDAAFDLMVSKVEA